MLVLDLTHNDNSITLIDENTRLELGHIKREGKNLSLVFSVQVTHNGSILPRNAEIELPHGGIITLTDKGKELGQIKRITPYPPNQSKMSLGFDFPKHITVIRDKLTIGKEPVNGKQKE